MRNLVRILHVCCDLKTGGIQTFIKSLIDLNKSRETTHDLLILNRASKEFCQYPCKVYYLGSENCNFFRVLKKIKKITVPYKSIFIHAADPRVVLPLIFSKKRIFLFQHGMTVSHGCLVKRYLKKIWFSIVPFLLDAKVICANEFAYKKIRKLGILIPRKKITIIPFGTRIKKSQGKIRDILEKDRIIIGMANVLVPSKRNALVIKSLASYKGRLNIEIRIAGDGPDLPYLKRLSANVTSNKVCIDFLGNVDDMDGFYQQLDLFILPSKNESFGLVVLEALSRFIPVAVFSDVGGCMSLIVEGRNGEILKDGIKSLKKFWNYINDYPEMIRSRSEFISKMDLRKYDILNTRIKLDNLAMI